MELWFTMEKLWYYGQNYGSIPKTMEFRFSERKQKHDRLPKTKKNWISVEKYGTIPKQLTILKKIYSFRTLIYYGKTMVVWKNYSSMKKPMVLWKKTMVL